MAQTSCSCSLKGQMITEKISVPKQFPGKEAEWGDGVFQMPESAEVRALCSLLAYLLYRGYCKKGNVSLSVGVGSVLSSRMEKQRLN